MAPGSAPGRRGRRTANGSSMQTLRRDISTKFYGQKLNLRGLGPAPLVQRPWYPLKVHLYHREDSAKAIEVQFTITNLVGALAAQLGLTTQDKAKITIKAQRVEAWSVGLAPNNDRPSVAMDVTNPTATLSDPTSGSSAVHYGVAARILDQGSRLEPARAGFIWPVAAQQTILNQQSDFNLVTVTSNTGGIDCFITVLWSTTDVQAPIE